MNPSPNMFNNNSPNSLDPHQQMIQQQMMQQQMQQMMAQQQMMMQQHINMQQEQPSDIQYFDVYNYIKGYATSSNNKNGEGEDDNNNNENASNIFNKQLTNEDYEYNSVEDMDIEDIEVEKRRLINSLVYGSALTLFEKSTSSSS